MLRLLTGASIAAILTISPVLAQTTSPGATQEQGATQSTSPTTTTPSTTEQKSSEPSPQGGAQAAAQDPASSVTLTADQAKGWVDKPVFSSDGKEIGEVYEFKRGSDNKVTELHADIGGYLGWFETRVKLEPSEFKLQGNRVVLSLSEEQAKAEPKVEN